MWHDLTANHHQHALRSRLQSHLHCSSLLCHSPRVRSRVQIVAPGDSKVVPGEGICGGELVICFDITFPKTLSMEQKKKIKQLGM